MTIRPRSSSDVDLSTLEMAQGKDSLEKALDASQDSAPLKKIKTASTEALERCELNALQQDPHVEESLKKDRDYALMNNPDISIRKIRHIIIERWIKAITEEPNNGVLLFNYGRMHPLLTEDHALGRGLNGIACVNDLLNDIDSSHQYVYMNQDELFHEAAKKDFQGKCIYQRLAKEYQFINYTTLGRYSYLGGGYEGTLNTDFARKNFLKLIELYPNDDRNYVLLGKLINYISIVSQKMASHGGEKGDEIAFPPNMNSAKDLYLKALELNPLNDEAYVGLGLIEGHNHRKHDQEKAKECYLKALHLNPHNLEAALLLLEKISTVTFSDDRVMTIEKVIEEATQQAPHSLAMIPHWSEILTLSSRDSEKNYLSIVLRKFITSPSIEKHIKRNTLRYLMNSHDHSYGMEFAESITNLLSFLINTPLADPDQDRKLLEDYIAFADECEDVSFYITSLFIELLKAYFPYDQLSLKNLIPSLIDVIDNDYEGHDMAYYYLALLLSPHETLKVQEETLNQQELYKEAAYRVYNAEYSTDNEQYTFDLAAKILGTYALTLEDEKSEEKQDPYNYKSFTLENNPSFTKKNILLKALSVGYSSPWPYFYLGKAFKKPIEVEGKRFNSSKELFLTALDIDPYHAESYHQLGNTVYSGENITLLDGTRLSCQQLYTRSIQLGVQDPDAYFQAAKSLKKNQGVILFDDFTYLSKIDLLFRAFSMNETSSHYLKQIALYFQNIKGESGISE